MGGGKKRLQLNRPLFRHGEVRQERLDKTLLTRFQRAGLDAAKRAERTVFHWNGWLEHV
jgi:hypothetical protein